MQLRRASRKKVKMRVALSGPSGSGKTMSALLMAYGITGDWAKVALIDTEHNSAEHYAVSSTLGTTEEDTFNVLELDAPYTPDRYIKAIETCEQAEGIEVIVIDSASHEWNGKGGILEMKDSMSAKSSFNAWQKLTPEHNKFIEKILSSSCHVFACFRAKTDYVLVNKDGKQVPEKVGLKPITREEVDFEFSVWFDLDIMNNAVAAKDRTELFMGRPDFRITKDTGAAMRAWAEMGKAEVRKTELQLAIEELRACSDRECTVGVYKKYKHLESNAQFMAVLKEMSEKYPKTDNKEQAAAPQQSAPEPEPAQQEPAASTPMVLEAPDQEPTFWPQSEFDAEAHAWPAEQKTAIAEKPAPKQEAKTAPVQQKPAPKQAKAEAVPANKPGMITEAQKQEVIRLASDQRLERTDRTKALLGLPMKTEEQANQLIDQLNEMISALGPEKPAVKVPEGIEAEEELIQQIRYLINESEVFSESEVDIVERRLTSITKLQARELLDDVKRTVRDRKEVAA